MEKQLLWETVLAELRLNLSDANYQTWFKGKTQINSSENGLIEIGCQSAFIKNWLEQRYYQQIKIALDRLLGTNTSLVFAVAAFSDKVVVRGKQKPENQSAPLFEIDHKAPSQQRHYEANLNPNYTFENFVIGTSNQLAHAVASVVAKSPGKEYNPFFLYGGVGVGKTHLIQAIGNLLLTQTPEAKVVYCTSEKFTNEMIESIQLRKTTQFRNKYRNVDLLIIDDIQFIAGRESTQEEFFHTFNALYASGKQIVLTSDRPPVEIKKLEERLRSRFEGGMIADIQNPDIDLREAILLSKCKLQNQNISTEIIHYLAQTTLGSVRDLEGYLVRLITRAKMSGENYSLELAKKIVGDRLVERRPTSAKKVVELVSSYFGIKIVEIKGERRLARFVLPRQIAMYLLRKELGLPLEQIAETLNRKDHTTVLHGVDKIEKSVVNSEQLASWVHEIRSQILEA